MGAIFVPAIAAALSTFAFIIEPSPILVCVTAPSFILDVVTELAANCPDVIVISAIFAAVTAWSFIFPVVTALVPSFAEVI